MQKIYIDVEDGAGGHADGHEEQELLPKHRAFNNAYSQISPASASKLANPSSRVRAPTGPLSTT